MNKTILAFLYIFILLSEAKHLLKRSHSKDFTCDHPFVLINWQYNLPLTLKNISSDDKDVAKYADLVLDATNTATTSWCKLDGGRIQNVETGLYLNVHGPGLVCWARSTCEWATQVDAYYTQGTTWLWNDVPVSFVDGGETRNYHQLQAMGRTLLAYPGGTVNLGVIDDSNKAELWIFHLTK